MCTQILNADHRKYVIEYIKALIEAHKKELDNLDGNEPPEAVEGKYSYSNVTLKAPQHWQAVPPATFQFNVASELGEYAQHCEGVDLVEEIKDFVDKKSEIIGFSARGVEFCVSIESTPSFHEVCADICSPKDPIVPVSGDLFHLQGNMGY